ncbi:mitochondrial arginine transporter BAC2 isoform X2 [Physcomitrium patens]|uniref:mitochondrial arginine transporter BAC2 isoform X2 n=1 Tax=Physcomitrium patens TaxID=3218 RepID=UPI003CCD7AC8
MSATEELYPFPDSSQVFLPMEFWPEFLASTTGTEFLAGGMGGMAGVMAGHPLDTVRIRLQQPRIVASTAPTTATGLIKHIVSTEGPMALFKGMATPLATIAFQNAVSFQAYALFSRALSDPGSQSPLSYEKVAIAGIAAGTIQTGILTPVDLIKIRLQIATDRRAQRKTLKSQQAGPLGLVRNIVRREGIKGLYRGWNATVIRDGPSHAGGAPPQYKGIMDCIRTSARQEGNKVFWRGLGPSLARAFLVNGAIFSAYELSLRYLSPRSPNGEM